MRKEKYASDTQIESNYIVRPSHLNGAGRLFGGTLMEWMDEITAMAAMQFYEGDVVTGTVDSLVFIKGAVKGDMINLSAKVTYTTRSTIEVKVNVHVTHLDGRKELINQAFFVLVAIPKAEGQPIELPLLIPQTEEEKLDWENGSIRALLRKERRMDNF